MLPALLDRVDDHRQAGRHQHDGRRRARRVRRARNGDAAVGLLQRRGVVHAVAGHADDVAALLQDIDDVELVFGEDLGEAVGLSRWTRPPPRSRAVFESPRLAASRMFVPMPSFLAVSLAMASASPVTILIFTPICRAVAMVALASSRGGSNRGSTPSKLPVAVAVGPRHAQRAKAARREFVDRLVDGGLHLRRRWPTSSKITCGAPLVTLNCFPSAPLTVASVRLCTGSNGWK